MPTPSSPTSATTHTRTRARPPVRHPSTSHPKFENRPRSMHVGVSDRYCATAISAASRAETCGRNHDKTTQRDRGSPSRHTPRSSPPRRRHRRRPSRPPYFPPGTGTERPNFLTSPILIFEFLEILLELAQLQAQPNHTDPARVLALNEERAPIMAMPLGV